MVILHSCVNLPEGICYSLLWYRWPICRWCTYEHDLKCWFSMAMLNNQRLFYPKPFVSNFPLILGVPESVKPLRLRPTTTRSKASSRYFVGIYGATEEQVDFEHQPVMCFFAVTKNKHARIEKHGNSLKETHRNYITWVVTPRSKWIFETMCVIKIGDFTNFRFAGVISADSGGEK